MKTQPYHLSVCVCWKGEFCLQYCLTSQGKTKTNQNQNPTKQTKTHNNKKTKTNQPNKQKPTITKKTKKTKQTNKTPKPKKWVELRVPGYSGKSQDFGAWRSSLATHSKWQVEESLLCSESPLFFTWPTLPNSCPVTFPLWWTLSWNCEPKSSVCPLSCSSQAVLSEQPGKFRPWPLLQWKY